jgi:cytochrome b561
MTKPTRYHPLLVAIHWTSALLIVFMLAFGTLILARLPNNADKLLPLTLHMVTGLLILVLTITRFIVRLATPKPEPATIGNKFLDTVGVVTHWLLYLGAFGMGLSGLFMAIQSGLFGMIASGTSRWRWMQSSCCTSARPFFTKLSARIISSSACRSGKNQKLKANGICKHKRPLRLERACSV